LKRTRQARGAQILAEFAELAGSLTFLYLGVRMMTLLNPYNLIVTNVPARRCRLSSRRSARGRLSDGASFREQGLGVALFSYDGTIFWGFNADWDSSPT
jgi:hypothetical protein